MLLLPSLSSVLKIHYFGVVTWIFEVIQCELPQCPYSGLLQALVLHKNILGQFLGWGRKGGNSPLMTLANRIIKRPLFVSHLHD